MSTQPITSSAYSSGTSLSSQGSRSPLQITGLASGLDTNAIVQSLMAIERQPVIRLQAQQTKLQSTNTQLTGIQTALQGLAAKAQALADPTLFANSQTVSSTNASLVSATATSGNGAVQGGYQLTVSQLASSSQRTYTFTSPTAAETVTIDGTQISLAAGASAQDFVNAVNSNTKASVWATATDSGTVVLSDRLTGAPPSGGTYITLTDSGTALREQTGLAQAGVNALYTINGQSGQSSSNTISGTALGAGLTPDNTKAAATRTIAGVALTLSGLTPSGSSITVAVSPPTTNSQNIQTAVQSFVSAYNTVIGQIQTQLAQKPSSSDPTQGTLFGDPDLTNLLASMRQQMYAAGGGLPSGMATMMDIGVSTGAATGGGTPSQSAIAGSLTLNATTLTNALAGNPSGVKQVLQSWSITFSKLVNDQAAPGGTIDSRVQGDTSQITNLTNQINNLNATLNDKQAALTAQFAKLEGALSQNQSMSNWLTGQIAALPTP